MLNELILEKETLHDFQTSHVVSTGYVNFHRKMTRDLGKFWQK